MTYQPIADKQLRVSGSDARQPAAPAAPDVAVRVVGALLALGITAAHVADQGGVTALDSPDWMGWSFRLIEAGGAATAVVLLLSPLVPASLAWAGWGAGALLGAGPFAGYLLSRSVGVPGDQRDVGNWGDWVGTVSLLVEAALVVLSVGMLLAFRRCAGHGGGLVRSGDRAHSGGRVHAGR